MRNFVYLSNDDIPLANATVTWVMDKAREELKHSDKICGFCTERRPGARLRADRGSPTP